MQSVPVGCRAISLKVIRVSQLGPGGGLILSRKMTNLFHFGLDHRDTILQFSTVSTPSTRIAPYLANITDSLGLPQMGWIVYNLSINFLTVGGTVICYDGSPFHPPETLWRLVEKYK
jgi:acetoacetyl-CoA synthetase